MDQKKNQGQPDSNQSQNPNPDRRAGRQEMPGRDQSGQQYKDANDDRGNEATQRPATTPVRGRGIPGERNSSSGSGISNRGLDREEEQEDLPDRGSGQSER